MFIQGKTVRVGIGVPKWANFKGKERSKIRFYFGIFWDPVLLENCANSAIRQSGNLAVVNQG